MFRDKRLNGIVRTIHQHGFATVPQLCAQFGASPATIRRDLQELSQKQLIQRNRNGAVPPQELHAEASVHFRAAVNARAKQKIARAACELLTNGSLIFMDSSTTVLSMVDFLPAKRNLTIVSNSLLLMTLMRDTEHKLVLTGGEYYAPSHAFYGEWAEEALNAYNFDFAFLSSVSITPDGWAAETMEHSVAVRRTALQRAKTRVLLCDKSKMNLRRPFNMTHIDAMDYLITDDPVYPEHACTRVIRV